MAMVVESRGAYVNGRWRPAPASGLIDVVNPATEQVIARVPDCVTEDVTAAVEAAQAALPAWGATSVADRQHHLRAIADGLRRAADSLARTIVEELGAPIRAATSVQTRTASDIFTMFADQLDTIMWERQVGQSRVVADPAGVVGAITPWNYPLYQLACKVGAALAAGCTVVVKPSELTPLSAYDFCEIVDGLDVPPGVLNMVPGTGLLAGEALAGHPGLDVLSFTGSTHTGRRVATLAAGNLTKVILELGGKSASIVLDGVDLEMVVPAVVRNCFRNSGQVCSAHSRLLVRREVRDRAVEIAAAAAEQIRVGDPHDTATEIGPLVSAAQRARVWHHIEQGAAEGARLVAGGTDPPDDLARGYYVRPTVFADVDNSMTIAQEEIFGPVLSVISYEDEADAIRIANDSRYGLSGGVWAASTEDATRVARRLRTGEVEINGAPFNVRAPFGGVKKSGHGRELGQYGIEEFLVPKAIHR